MITCEDIYRLYSHATPKSEVWQAYKGKTNPNKTAWDIAMENRDMKIAALLSGSDPKEDKLAAIYGNMDIFQALYSKNMEALNALLHSGVELQTVCEHKEMYDFFGKSPLACALIWFIELPEAAEMILAAGANPNYCFADENTAFSVMIGKDFPSRYTERCADILKQMSQSGWNPEMPVDKEGNTALSLACRYVGYSSGKIAIHYLMEIKATVNPVNLFGQTPLMILYGGHPALPGLQPYGWKVNGDEETFILEILLEAGADTGKKDNWGNTVLHYIAASCRDTGAKNAMNLLLDFKFPDIYAINNEGLTALDIATNRNNEAVVEFLLNYS